VLRHTTLAPLAASVLLAAALIVPAAGADSGPLPPVCPPSPIPAVSGVTTCTSPAPSPAPAAAPASAPSSASPSAQGPGSTKAPKRFSVASTPDLARQLLAAVNATRRAHGLRPLRLSAALTEAAYAHAQSLAAAGQFTHAWPTTNRVFGRWIRNFYSARGYRRWSAGENLLWASPGFTAAGAVQQWLASPVHRRVMLTPSWRELGVGVVAATAAPGAYGGRDVQIGAAEFGSRS
jgi:uncharacterized protein YkwD